MSETMCLNLLFKFIIVGVPEICIILLIGLVLGYGKNFRSKITKLHLKMLLSITIILIFLFYLRTNISSIVLISSISFFLYSASYNAIFGIRGRRSLIIGAVSVYLSVMTDFLIIPFIDMQTIFEYKLQLTLLSRSLQIIIFLVLMKWNLNLGKIKLLDVDSKNLTKIEKLDLIAVVTFPVLTVLFNSSYCDMVLNLPEVMIKHINLSLNIYFTQNVLLLFVNLYVLHRIQKYYIFKDFLERGHEEIFLDVMAFAIAEKEDLNKYKKIIEALEKENFDEKDNE